MDTQFKFGATEPVVRTRPAIPSKLHVLELCPLRYVIETERQGPATVLPGPMALRGTAVHAVIQRYRGHAVPAASELLGAFSASVANQANAAGANALVRLAFASAGVKGLLTTEQILGACQFAREVLIKAPQPQRPPGTAPDRGHGAARPTLIGTERKLTSIDLDMEGRPDLIYKDGAVMNIVDYKAGNILAANGEIKRAYAIQAAAYGVLVKALAGTPPLLLTVTGPSSSWSGGLDAAAELLIHELLATLQFLLPKNKPVASATLARAGPHCGSCASRLFCPSYVPATTVALASWQRHDVSGTVSEIAWTGGLGSLRIKRGDGTMASIAGVPSILHAELARGDFIRAWSLGALDLPGRTAIASNFYLFRPDTPRISSFDGAIHVE